MRVTYVQCSRDCGDRMRYMLYTAEIGPSGYIHGVGHAAVYDLAVVINWFRALTKNKTRPGLYEHMAIESSESIVASEIISRLFDVTNIVVMDHKYHKRLLEDIALFSRMGGRWASFGQEFCAHDGFCNHEKEK